jgi:uncharacterized protein (DUF2384 family)
MPKTTLTPDINSIKSQLEIEISKYQDEIYIRQAKIQALDIFGNSNAVDRWLTEKNPALDGISPDRILNSAAGLERVIDLINAIKHGVFM